ncbi:hypothetical protein LXL04_008360 [Taraxacum kok-saghyz]
MNVLLGWKHQLQISDKNALSITKFPLRRWTQEYKEFFGVVAATNPKIPTISPHSHHGTQTLCTPLPRHRLPSPPGTIIISATSYHHKQPQLYFSYVRFYPPSPNHHCSLEALKNFGVLWEITQSIHGRASSVIWKLLPTPMTLWILETEDVSSEIRKQRVERNDEDREDSVQWLLPHQFMRGNAIKMPKRWLTTCLPRIRVEVIH